MKFRHVWVTRNEKKKLGVITEDYVFVGHHLHKVFLPSEKREVCIRKEDIQSETARTSSRIEKFKKKSKKKAQKKKQTHHNKAFPKARRMHRITSMGMEVNI